MTINDSNSLEVRTIVSAPTTSPTAVPESAKALAHHGKNSKSFINPWQSYTDRSAWQMTSMMVIGFITGTFRFPKPGHNVVPVHRPRFLQTRETLKLRATWLGHACYYVEYPSGLRVLFDPVFTERCAPSTWFGPKRFTEMPCQIRDIPYIDAVCISHNHYDHLSHPTILEIQNKFPNCHFFAPLGNKKWFDACGVKNSTELDWWQSCDITVTSPVASVTAGKGASVSTGGSDIVGKIQCLPCQHTSARTPFDKAHTLWSSWGVTSAASSVWFGGDTGYRSVPKLPKSEDDYDTKKYPFPVCPAFKDIGKYAGPFDLGLIPIGAYDPRYIMSPQHANPFDSVNIFKDTNCKRAMAIHWGTWVLTTEDVLEPPKLLKEALRKKGLAEEGLFDICDIGESREF